MAKAIVRRRQTAETLPAVDDRQANARRLVDRFLSDGKAATLRAYEGDLRDFAVWLEAPGPAGAVAHLLSLEAGQAHGFKPHGLRHAGITGVADLSGGDLFKTMAFSRHKNANTVQLYVDNVRDDAGEMGAALGEQAQAALEARQRPPEGN